METVTDTAARWRDELFDRLPDNGVVKWLVLLLGLYLFAAVLLGMFWSIAPGSFDVREQARELAAEEGGSVVTGSVTTGALIEVMET